MSSQVLSSLNLPAAFSSSSLTFLLVCILCFSAENRAVGLKAEIKILEAEVATLKLEVESRAALEAEVKALELEVGLLRAQR